MSGATTNWTIPHEMGDVLNQQDKRLSVEERRPRIVKASDLMGPLAGPRAIQVDNLNGDTASFNGQIIVPPDAAGSPDVDKWWIGWISASAQGGVQMLSTFMSVDEPHIQMIRRWDIIPSNGERNYTAWEQIGGPPPTPVTSPFGYCLRTSNQNLSNTTWTHIDFNSQELEGGMAWTSSRLVVPSNGIYTIAGGIRWGDSSAGTRTAQITINDSESDAPAALQPGNAAGAGISSILSVTLRLVANDTIGLLGYQSSGGTLAASSTRQGTYLSAVKVSD